VLITWRNNVFHELADNRVHQKTREALAEHSELICATYRSLLVDGLVAKAEKGEALTFKETASLINATHAFVQEVDAAVLSRLDVRLFCVDAVVDALSANADGGAFSAKYHSLTGEARSRFLRNWFQNVHGLSGLSDEVVSHCAALRRSNAG
jgi:hypothetical protein